jgi:hypothetical protein
MLFIASLEPLNIKYSLTASGDSQLLGLWFMVYRTMEMTIKTDMYIFSNKDFALALFWGGGGQYYRRIKFPNKSIQQIILFLKHPNSDAGNVDDAVT